MPNIKSSIRRVRKTRNQTTINRIRKSKYKSAVKQMSIYLDAGKIKEAKSFLPEIPLTIDENCKNWNNKQKNCFKKNFKNYKKN